MVGENQRFIGSGFGRAGQYWRSVYSTVGPPVLDLPKLALALVVVGGALAAAHLALLGGRHPPAGSWRVTPVSTYCAAYSQSIRESCCSALGSSPFSFVVVLVMVMTGVSFARTFNASIEVRKFGKSRLLVVIRATFSELLARFSRTPPARRGRGPGPGRQRARDHMVSGAVT